MSIPIAERMPTTLYFDSSRILRWTWAAVFALILADCIAIQASHIKVNVIALLEAVRVLGVMSGVMLYRHVYPIVMDGRFTVLCHWRKRPLPYPSYAVQLVGQLVIGTHAIAALSYLCARSAFPLADRLLVDIDQMLFFNWQGFTGWVNLHPPIAKLLSFCYGTMVPEIILCIVIFIALRQDAQLQRFVLQFMTGAFIVTMISTLAPATGAYRFYHVDVAHYPNPVALHDNDLIMTDFFSMRQGSLVLPGRFNGLVAFPSFHALVAVLMISAASYVQNRYATILIMALNMLMIISTLTDGAHYLIDVIVGIILAIAILYASYCLIPATARFAKLEKSED